MLVLEVEVLQEVNDHLEEPVLLQLLETIDQHEEEEEGQQVAGQEHDVGADRVQSVIEGLEPDRRVVGIHGRVD